MAGGAVLPAHATGHTASPKVKARVAAWQREGMKATFSLAILLMVAVPVFGAIAGPAAVVLAEASASGLAPAVATDVPIAAGLSDDLLVPPSQQPLAVDAVTANVDLFEVLWKAAHDGQWRLVIAVALLIAVMAVRRYSSHLPGKIDAWLKSDAGAVSFTWLASGLASVVTTLMSGHHLGWDALTSAVGVATSAAGGYTAIRKALWPAALWVWSKVRKQPPAAA